MKGTFNTTSPSDDQKWNRNPEFSLKPVAWTWAGSGSAQKVHFAEDCVGEKGKNQ